jgi:hypothetical protein
VLESPIDVVAGRLGEASRAARSAVLGILSDNLRDE